MHNHKNFTLNIFFFIISTSAARQNTLFFRLNPTRVKHQLTNDTEMSFVLSKRERCCEQNARRAGKHSTISNIATRREEESRVGKRKAKEFGAWIILLKSPRFGFKLTLGIVSIVHFSSTSLHFCKPTYFNQQVGASGVHWVQRSLVIVSDDVFGLMLNEISFINAASVCF